MSQYIANNRAGFSNNSNAFDVRDSDTITGDPSQLLAWLSPLDPSSRHWEIQEHRASDVGEWLIQTEEFNRWYAGSEGGGGESAVLFGYGNPGVGKTFISSLVVDRLCDQTGGRNAAVSCFYLDFAARKEQSATNVLGSLLKQMVSGMERIPEEISRAFQQQGTTISGRRPQLGNIVRMLQVVTSLRPTFMVIDALDECSGAQRARLLNSLKQILERSTTIRIFATGRPHILAEIEKRLAGHVQSVSISPTRKDITWYLRIKLDEDEMPDVMDESLEEDILEKIPENASEMFRLVSLSIGAVLRESTIYRRRERLNGMGDGLGWEGAYGMTIERIKALDGDQSRLGMAALMWVSYAERPLTTDELCHALAVELGSKDFNTGNAPLISTLVSCSQGLLAVDKETSTVRLIHLTVEDYLSARPDLFSGPHSSMAEICLTYLNSNHLKVLSALSSSVVCSDPFLGYCSVYWGVHAKRQLSECARLLALDLLREYDGHISGQLLLEQVEYLDCWDFDTNFGSDFDSQAGVGFYGDSSAFSGLHCASFFGIAEVLAALIQTECYDVNNPDVSGKTPLSYAAWKGHAGVVEILLGQEGVNLQTPLAYAASGGHEEVVKILLRLPEVSPDQQSNSGRTPLLHAASGGHEGVVKILLERGEVNPDKEDNEGDTPLLYAARGGHEGVVKVLLERGDVDPERLDNYGRTPLHSAVRGGHEGVVKVLLERGDVDPESLGDCGVTPLHSAAQGGHEGVVKVLLERGKVNPDILDNSGETAFLKAARRGREGVVKILLALPVTNPDKPNHHGSTPLLLAAHYGHENVVKILLDREEVNPDKRDNDGDTPLLCAARCGHEGVVKVLLEKERVNPGNISHVGLTPLRCAVSNGHKGVVELLKLHQAAAHVTPLGPGDTTG